MSLLSKVETGKQYKPQIYVVMGNNGVGKTTFAGSFPNALIVDLEDGSSHLDVSRITDITKFYEIKNLIQELINSDHNYKTLVIDSVESLESMIQKQICEDGGVDSIEKYDGGFGKGYVRSREMMTELMQALRHLGNKKGLDVVLVAHTQVKTHNDPVENAMYDRWIMRVNDKFGAVIKDLSDNVFFATYKVHTQKEKGKDKSKAFSEGERILRTQWRAGFDAKNRLDLPFEIPLSYEALKAAIDQSNPPSLDELQAEIKELMSGVDKELSEKVKAAIKDAGQDVTKLIPIRERLKQLKN